MVPLRDEKKKQYRRLLGQVSNGVWANCFSFRYQSRICSRRSRTEHETRHITVLARDIDTLKMTNSSWKNSLC